jgi:hypothetical protein
VFLSGGRLRRPCCVWCPDWDVAAEVERLRAQHVDAVREKSAVESKNRKLAEKVAALEAEKTDLRR